MKNYTYLTLLLILFSACQKEEVHPYLGTDLVQFGQDNEDLIFSFAYSGDEAKRDTMWIPAHISGDIAFEKRYYKLKQVTHYTTIIERAEDSTIINEYVIETPNQAVSGVHYLPFDDPEYQELCYVDSNKVQFLVPVILLRDASLQDGTKLLNMSFVESEAFQPGDVVKRKQVLNISDDVFYPENWPDEGPGAHNKFKSVIFGNYGPVKHRFMIQVTSQRWDDAFMKALSYEERLAYKLVCANALFELNKKREAAGEGPLLEDPSFMYGPVTF